MTEGARTAPRRPGCLLNQSEKKRARHEREGDQQRVMAPSGYHSNHVSLLQLTHVLYGGRTIHFQAVAKHVAGLKNG
jgi:hypothetical protein